MNPLFNIYLFFLFFLDKILERLSMSQAEICNALRTFIFVDGDFAAFFALLSGSEDVIDRLQLDQIRVDRLLQVAHLHGSSIRGELNAIHRRQTRQS